MSEGPSIQHKAGFRTEAGFAFDDDGRRVPIAPPADDDAAPADDDEALAAPLPRILDMLLFGTSNLNQIGERAALLAFCDRRCQYRPKSFRELGDWLGCSHTAARKKVSTFIRIIKGEFRV